MATAKKTVSWKGSAGSQPGQYQNIAVTFKKRAGKKVTCSVTFSARSYGMDSYPSSSRHNHCTLIIKRKTGTDKKGNNTYKQLATHTWNYACNPGNKVSRSYKDTFSFTLDDDDLTAVYIWYDNNRVGNNIPFKSPKTTGAVNNKFLGKMSAGHPGKVTIKFSSGCINKNARTNLLGGVKNLPESVDIKYGSDFTIPKNVVTAKNGYYVFTGWDTNDKWKTYRKKTTVTKLIRISKPVSGKSKKGKKSVTYEKYETFTRKINTTSPSKKAGAKIKNVTKDMTLYACWERVSYTYRFFKSQDFAMANPLKVLDKTDPTNIIYEGEFNGLKQKRLAGKATKKVPNSPPLEAIPTGYTFWRWAHYLSDGTIKYHYPGGACNINKNINSWAEYKSLGCTLMFDYGYDDRIEPYYLQNPEWIYTTEFGQTEGVYLRDKCTNSQWVKRSPSDIRPGYKLVGWSLSLPDPENPDKRVFLPGENITVDFRVDDVYRAPAEDNKDVIFYAIWIYTSNMYVYSDTQQFMNELNVELEPVKKDSKEGPYSYPIPKLATTYSGPKWHKVRPYVYTDNKWQPALGDVYVDNPGEWKTYDGDNQ